MREINFRAWDNEEKEMIDNLSQIDLSSGYSYYPDSSENLQRVSNKYLMQSTGLLDKEGVMIFEGDIIEDGGGMHKHWILEYKGEEFATLNMKILGYDGGYSSSEAFDKMKEMAEDLFSKDKTYNKTMLKTS